MSNNELSRFEAGHGGVQRDPSKLVEEKTNTWTRQQPDGTYMTETETHRREVHFN